MIDPPDMPLENPIEVLPVVVLSRIFPARPSSIPEIQEFVRRGLADSSLPENENRALTQRVFRALLHAAGPEGTIQISIRIFPEDVEVDVLHSDGERPGPVAVPSPSGSAPRTFAEWMSDTLRREGLTQEAAARQLGVSVRTVSRWLGGETEPRLRDLRRIRERFGDIPLP
ncbi:helix-turn-helix domain-containing protein [Planobispora takensis]|uniref:XRE family transcriptional regulator n=1 Tax=Planobispora takensis TaxID=1367882 RepID=A0A8J3WS41_9ACTN|nr:helix-turn-helix transcriptional regulator [Planobispora takensis]GII00145.1 XRE family transcriptional regulator [Planobispora takensis]